MKVQILLDNMLINTQIVSTQLLGEKPSLRDVKRLALKAALEDKAIKINELLRVTFRLFDVAGNPIDD